MASGLGFNMSMFTKWPSLWNINNFEIVLRLGVVILVSFTNLLSWSLAKHRYRIKYKYVSKPVMFYGKENHIRFRFL